MFALLWIARVMHEGTNVVPSFWAPDQTVMVNFKSISGGRSRKQDVS